METTYHLVTHRDKNIEGPNEVTNFDTYDDALKAAEKVEDMHEVHIHQVDDGVVVECLWDNEVRAEGQR